MIRSVAGLALLFAFAAQGEDLLRNGDFEDYEALMPRGWSLFLQPHNAATLADGRTDTDIVNQGNASIRLDNPVRYERDPWNNWSQHVDGGVSGKRLVLRGSIKTAGDAQGVIWLQAGIKRPYQFLLEKSTAENHPVGGDRDWTPVEVEIDVPVGAEFVTVRCVMEGVGTVWFDDLSLMDARDIEVTPEPTETEPELDPIEMEPEIVTEPSPTSEPEPVIIRQPAPRPRDPSAVELLDANQALQATVEALRETNSALMDELRINRNEIAGLRRELEMLRGDIDVIGEQVSPGRAVPRRRSDIPPLVPGNDPRRIN